MMTYTHIAKRLLEHGPLTSREFREISGWPKQRVDGALINLVKTSVAVRNQELGSRHWVYRLTA